MTTNIQEVQKGCKQVELDEIPEGWEEFSLSEAMEVSPKRELKKGIQAKFVSMADLKGFDKKIKNFVIKKFSGGSKFINGDTLMARITPCLENGKTAFVDILEDGEIGSGSTEFIVLSAKEGKTTDQFVYYLSISPEIRRDAIKSMTGSSGRQRVESNVFDKISISLPSLIEQHAIAKILSDLDGKIELNHQMNKTLESIAQAIFKKWFVDFEFPNEKGKPYKSSGGKMVGSELGEMPIGWEEGCLSDMLEISISGDWGDDNEFEDAIQAISLRGTDLDSLKSSGYAAKAPIRWIRKDRLESRIVNNCNILIGGSGLGPIGKTIYCSEYLNNLYNFPVTYSNFCKCLTAEMPAFAIFAEHILENMYLSGEMNQFYTGTSIPNLDINSLMRYPIMIPSKGIILQFCDIAVQKFPKLFDKENILLSQIRDSLLPRLMSGKVRVNNG